MLNRVYNLVCQGMTITLAHLVKQLHSWGKYVFPFYNINVMIWIKLEVKAKTLLFGLYVVSGINIP